MRARLGAVLLVLAAAAQQLRRVPAWWMSQPHQVPAALMLLTCWLVFYAWPLVPPALQAEAWNIGGATGRLLLLWLVVLAYPSAPVFAAGLWWTFEDAQVVLCGLLWVLARWPVDSGSRCSDRFSLPLGLVGAALGGMAAWWVLRATLQAWRGGRP